MSAFAVFMLNISLMRGSLWPIGGAVKTKANLQHPHPLKKLTQLSQVNNTSANSSCSEDSSRFQYIQNTLNIIFVMSDTITIAILSLTLVLSVFIFTKCFHRICFLDSSPQTKANVPHRFQLDCR